MEKTDAAVATVADKLGDKALQYLQSFEELAKQYSPDVVDAGLTVVRLYGAQEVVLGVSCLVIVLLIVFKAIPYIKADFEKEDGGNPAVQVAGSMACFFVGALTAMGAFDKLLTIWTYVAIFDPKLYLAYKIFGKLF